MKVDIIIPTYQPDNTFCLLLQKLQEQTFVVHRVIILNTEKTLWEQAQAQYPIEKGLLALPCPYKVIHVQKEDFDHGKTRMMGAMEADGEVLLFMTQDAMPADAHLVEHLVDIFDAQGQEAVAVAYARQLPNESCRIVEQYTREFNYPSKGYIKSKRDIPKLGIKTFFCSDVCAAYRKDLFLQLGGFEFPVIFNEDMFFAAKAIMAGYQVEYAADAKVIHSHNYSMHQQFQRNFDLAVSQTMHPEIFETIRSEAEGMKLVKSTMKYLCKIKKPYYIWNLGWQCVAKYVGYYMGKRYQRLSRKQILKYTMNQEYWRRIWKDEE